MGFQFASELSPGDTVGLFGNLGSGKTQFVKGICKYFGINENISSPTFGIVNEYWGKNIEINHFDLYRIANLNELVKIGIESYMKENSICLIEWAELFSENFKTELKNVYFEYSENENERIIWY